jgi:hypothetical protein
MRAEHLLIRLRKGLLHVAQQSEEQTMGRFDRGAEGGLLGDDDG